MTTSDDDRIAYLAGEAAGSLPAEDRAELAGLRSVLEAPVTWIDPHPGLEQRVVEAIESEAKVGPMPEPPPPDHPRRRPRAWPWMRFRRPAYGIAAVAIAAAAAIIVALSAQDSTPTPLHFAMVVSGTPLAPDARGSASLTDTSSGWRIELSARGLQHLANGRYYEAWLKNAAGVLVPVGTFNDARAVTLWSGVPVTKFRTLTVTEQRADGNPVSSGQRVLGGTIRPAG